MSPQEAKRTEIWANKSKLEQKNAPKRAKQKRKIEKTVNKSKKTENSRKVQTNEPKRAKRAKKSQKKQQEHKWAEMIRFFCVLLFLN